MTSTAANRRKRQIGSQSNPEVLVIGGGSAGLGAANAAARAGKRVLLINDGEPGGDCTFWGCVPSKALIAQSRKGASFSEAMDHVRSAVTTIGNAETFSVLEGHGISTANGRATFVAANTVEVDNVRFTAPKIIIATGSRAFVPPIPGLDTVSFLTNKEVFNLPRKPETMAILGGGPIGVELAQAMSRLGVKVTIFESLDRLMAREEPEASAVLGEALLADGVELRLAATVTSVAPVPTGGVRVNTSDSSDTFDQLLVATGRQPNSQGLQLDAAGVKLTDRGHIQTSDRLETSVDGIYAAGDVTGKLPFTHAADEMGRLAVGHALKLPQRWKFNERAVPWTTFTDPEIARVGLTEAQAASKGGKVAYLPMSEFDRAITDGTTDGFVKLIAGPKPITRRLLGGEIIGATIVTPRAGEMINEIALAMRTRMFTGRLGQSSHAYPTWGFAIPQTTAQFFFEQNGRTARPAR